MKIKDFMDVLCDITIILIVLYFINKLIGI